MIPAEDGEEMPEELAVDCLTLKVSNGLLLTGSPIKLESFLEKEAEIFCAYQNTGTATSTEIGNW